MMMDKLVDWFLIGKEKAKKSQLRQQRLDSHARKEMSSLHTMSFWRSLNRMPRRKEPLSLTKFVCNPLIRNFTCF